MRNPFAVAVSRMGIERKAAADGGLLISSMQDRQVLWSEWDTGKAIRDGFKASAILYRAIALMMQSVASVPWSAYVRDGKEWKPSEDHPLTELLEYPNEFMSRQQLMMLLTARMFTGGNEVLRKIRVREGPPVELWPTPDLSNIHPVPSRLNWIDRWEYHRDGQPFPIDPRDIIHTMFTDPANPFWGMSPLQAGARVIDTDVEAVRWNKLTLQNRAVTDGVFSAALPLQKDQWEQMREAVREQYAGADNARMPWVLGNGTTYQQMGLSPVEMDFLESRKFNREEIAGLIGVPLPLIVSQADNTYANYETSRKALWGDAVVPFLDLVKDTLNRSLVPDFGDRRRLMVGYDTSAIEALREDFHKKIETGERMQRMGWPLNAINQRLELGMEPVDGGDVSLVPSTMIPITMAGEGTDTGTPPDVL